MYIIDNWVLDKRIVRLVLIRLRNEYYYWLLMFVDEWIWDLNIFFKCWLLVEMLD